MARLGLLGLASLPLAAALALGCTSFPPLDRGVCGNGVLEPGEDCDSRDASCIACALSCATVTCPTGYACGADTFCHAPGGALAAPVIAGSFEVDDFAITDIDGDGIGDVIGTSQTALVVRHGDTAASLAETDTIVTPLQTGPAVFAQVDADASTDVTMLTLDGLVSYTSPYHVLSPRVLETALVSDAGVSSLLEALPINGSIVAGVVSTVGATQYVGWFATDLINQPVTAGGRPCNLSIPLSDFDPTMVHVYQTYPDQAILSLYTPVSNQTCLTRVDVKRDASGKTTSITLTDVTPATLGTLKAPPVLAKIKPAADPCPDLLDLYTKPSAMAPTLDVRDAISIASECAFGAINDSTFAAPATWNTTTVIVGRAPVGVSGLAPDALVTDHGVFEWLPGVGFGFIELFNSGQRTISRVASGDVNADGGIDIVVSSAGETGIDVLYRRTINGFPGYEVFRMSTAAEPSTITIADFDADGIADVNYTEPSGAHDRMMIAYGNVSHPDPAIEVATFSAVAGVTPIAGPDFSDPLSLATDLIVLQPGITGQAQTASVLHGSPQRTMLSYYDPRDLSDVATRDDVFVVGTIGNFATSSGTTQYPDLLTVAIQPVIGQAGANTKVWLSDGGPTGPTTAASTGDAFMALASCVPNKAPAQGKFCAGRTLFLPWTTGPAHDVVFAIDRGNGLSAVFDPWNVTVGMGPKMTSVTAFTQRFASAPPIVQSAYAADVDGDGANELVISFAGPLGAVNAGVVVCKVDATGVPSTCTDLGPAIAAVAPTAETCIDAVPGNYSFVDRNTPPAAGTPLVVLCNDSQGSALYEVTSAADGFHATALATTSLVVDALRSGDVTGDGVDDVLAIQGDHGARTLMVFPQCESRKLATCGRGGQ